MLDILPNLCYTTYTMKLKKILTEKGMTYRELALNTGYTEKHLNYIANGKGDCTTAVAKKIAEVLGVSLDELLSEPQASTTANAGSPPQTPEASGSDDAPVDDEEHTAGNEPTL